MTSPTLELRPAIIARLAAVSAVTALIGTRVYDRVPAKPVFPYVSFGPADEISADADCIRGFDISLQIDCWSRKVGDPEVSRMADAVRAALDRYEFILTDNAFIEIRHRITRIFRDPDGITEHAAMTFEGMVEQP